MLTFIESTFACQAHLVSKLAWVMTMFSQADTLHNTATVGRYLIKFRVTLSYTLRLEALK